MGFSREIVFRDIPVTVIYKESRRKIGLHVDTEGKVSITVSCITREEAILSALESKYDWIVNTRQKIREKYDATFRPETIEYGDLTIRVKRRATNMLDLRLTAPDAIAEVTVPLAMPLADIRKLVEPHVPRLRESRDRMRKALPTLAYVSGERHPLWGEMHELVVREGRTPCVRLEGKKIVMDIESGMDVARRRELMRLFLSRCVSDELGALVPRYEKLMQVRVAGITSRFMKSRWGSCTSRNRTIRINCMLARYPKTMLEYVVVHEMCHFWEKGHSQAFFDLVGRYCPDWKKAADFLDRASGEILV